MVAPFGVQAIAVATTNLDKATLAGHLPRQSALSPLTIVCALPPHKAAGLVGRTPSCGALTTAFEAVQPHMTRRHTDFGMC